MSLSVAGVWEAGVWAQTVWADGVWREGVAPDPEPEPEPEVEARDTSSAGSGRFDRWSLYERYLEQPERPAFDNDVILAFVAAIHLEDI